MMFFAPRFRLEILWSAGWALILFTVVVAQEVEAEKRATDTDYYFNGQISRETGLNWRKSCLRKPMSAPRLKSSMHRLAANRSCALVNRHLICLTAMYFIVTPQPSPGFHRGTGLVNK